MNCRKPLVLPLAILALILVASSAVASDAVSPDNGNGTIDLPPFDMANDPIPYFIRPGDKIVLQGNIPGGTIEILPTLTDYFNTSEIPGGSLGGDTQAYDALLLLDVDGTGTLAGFQRMMFMQVSVTSESGARNPGNALQDFDRAMVSMQGQLFGDPDFVNVSFSSGSIFGLPGVGHTTLTRLGPVGSDFAVDSFFDIAYEIEWQGAPGSVLQGLGSSTGDRGVYRMQTIPEPGSLILVIIGGAVGCGVFRQRNRAPRS